MKAKIGELNSKPIVVTNAPDTVTFNEILYTLDEQGLVILQKRDNSGNLTPIVNLNQINSVEITATGTKGPAYWVKGEDYIFYASTSTDLLIKTKAGVDITSHAEIVVVQPESAQGENDGLTAYKISSAYCAAITITDDEE